MNEFLVKDIQSMQGMCKSPEAGEGTLIFFLIAAVWYDLQPGAVNEEESENLNRKQEVGMGLS